MAIKLETVAPISLAISNNPYQLSADPLRVVSVTISADAANTAKIYIGDETVTASSGIELSPGESAVISTPLRPSGSEEFLLNEIYVVASTSGQLARAAVWRRKS